MKTIWKYEIETTDLFELEIPKGYKILDIQTQYEKPCIWVMVNPEQEKEKVKFRIHGTGHPVNDNNMEYIGTYQIKDGSLIFHLFKI